MDGFEGSHLVFAAAGPDPFEVITNAVKYVFALCTGKTNFPLTISVPCLALRLEIEFLSFEVHATL